MTGKAEKKLHEIGFNIFEPPKAVANYVPFTISGNILTISGQVSIPKQGKDYMGKVGDDIDTNQAHHGAKLCALYIIAQIKAALGELDRVKQIIKIQGFVNSTADFEEHPEVINGASDMLVEVFGDKGKHARIAVGVNSLPRGAAVEIDAVIEFE